MPITVTYDGENTMRQSPPGAFVFLLQAEPSAHARLNRTRREFRLVETCTVAGPSRALQCVLIGGP